MNVTVSLLVPLLGEPIITTSVLNKCSWTKCDAHTELYWAVSQHSLCGARRRGPGVKRAGTEAETQSGAQCGTCSLSYLA